MLSLAARKTYTNLLFREKRKMVRALMVAQTMTLTVKMLMQRQVSVLTIMQVVQIRV